MFTEGVCGGGGREGVSEGKIERGREKEGDRERKGKGVAETWHRRYERHSGQHR